MSADSDFIHRKWYQKVKSSGISYSIYSYPPTNGYLCKLINFLYHSLDTFMLINFLYHSLDTFTLILPEWYLQLCRNRCIAWKLWKESDLLLWNTLYRYSSLSGLSWAGYLPRPPVDAWNCGQYWTLYNILCFFLYLYLW